jgi:hypothetical protein
MRGIMDAIRELKSGIWGVVVGGGVGVVDWGLVAVDWN